MSCTDLQVRIDLIPETTHQRPKSNLQFGFTENLSSTMAAICFTETLGILGHELMRETQDVQKAFDVVNHSILLQSLYLGDAHYHGGMPLGTSTLT